MNKKQGDRIRRFASRGLFEPTDKNATIKWAETDQEFEQAFKLLYNRYLQLNYIEESKSFPLHYNTYNLLPDTKTAVMKKDGAVVSTVDIVMDSEQHKLPMGEIYDEELNELRARGRKLCEVGSLACSHDANWQNTFMPLFRVIFWRALNNGVNDICIMVNPKHVPFYKSIMMFELLGEEKFYCGVNAPAIALKMNLDSYEDKVRDAYKGFAPENSLYSYFYEWHRTPSLTEHERAMITSNHFVPMDANLFTYFIEKKENISHNLSESNHNVFDRL